MNGHIVFIIYSPSDVANTTFQMDVTDDVIINVTFSVQELADITKRKGSYSQTIKLPGTPVNNRAFKHVFNVQSFTGGWTPNTEIKCLIYSDGVQLFSGTFQLLSINVLHDIPEYECAIYSEEVSLWKKMDETLLLETSGISAFNHTWERAMFPNVFERIASECYVYALVDNFGLFHCKTLAPNNNGGFFGGILDWLITIMDRIIPLEAFKPAIYVKWLVDAIFAQHGYTYASNFFNSGRFEQLVIPYAGGASFLDSTANYCMVGFNGDFYFDGEPVVDAYYMEYDIYTGVTGYNFYNLDCGVWAFNYYTACANYSGRYYVDIYFYRLGGLADNWSITIQLHDINNNVLYDIYGNPCERTFSSPYAGYVTGAFTYFIVNIRASERVFVLLTRPPGSTGQEYFINSSGTQYSYAVFNLDKKLSFEGINVELQTGISPTIKQIDLLADLQKMFNLYFYANPQNPKEILIEPFDTFYNQTPVDWTQKIDTSRPQFIQCGDPANKKRLIFSYAKITDAQAAQYETAEREQYGARTYDTENFYGKGDEEIITKCGTIIPSQYRTNFVIGRTWTLEGNGETRENKIGYRIGYYNYVEMSLGGRSDFWAYPDANGEIDIATLNYNINMPYVGHVDNPYNIEYDLLFGMPRQIFWKLFDPANGTYAQYTNNNLFNRHWLNYVIETNSAEAMTITAYFQINILDVAKLDFRAPVYYNGILWRLLEISDYVIGQNVTAKCTLRRILNLTPFTPEAVAPYTNSGTALTTNNEYIPFFNEPVIGL